MNSRIYCACAWGSHTMGKARCLSFRQQIHDENDEEHYDKYKRYDSIPFEESYGPYVQNQKKRQSIGSAWF